MFLRKIFSLALFGSLASCKTAEEICTEADDVWTAETSTCKSQEEYCTYAGGEWIPEFLESSAYCVTIEMLCVEDGNIWTDQGCKLP